MKMRERGVRDDFAVFGLSTKWDGVAINWYWKIVDGASLRGRIGSSLFDTVGFEILI